MVSRHAIPFWESRREKKSYFCFQMSDPFFPDLFNLIKATTASRTANTAKVLSSYWMSKISGRVFAPPMPVSISVEPTTSCNLRCPECPSGLRSFTRPTGMLEEKLFSRLLEEVHPYASYLTLYFQGEPFLHPGFNALVSLAKKFRLYTATSTNAHFMTDETAEKTVASGLDRLIISVDGTTQETYEQYRIGGSLEKVKEGARRIAHWKRKLSSKTPVTVFQFLVVRPNEHQVGDVHRMAKELGVDRVVFKTAQVYDFEHGHPLIPENHRFARYRAKGDGTWQIKNPLKNQCWKMWHSCVITWDGKVVPCCFDKDAKHVMGDLSKQSLKEIWHGEKYGAFRAQLLRGRSEIDICTNCTEGTKVFA